MSFSAWLSGLSILLPLITGTLKFKHLNLEFKCLYCYVILGILCELICYCLNFRHTNTGLALSIYFLIEAEFLIFFILINSFTTKHKSLAFTFGIVFLVLWIYLMIYSPSIDEATSKFKTIISVVLSCCAGYGLFVLSNTSESNIFLNPLFWIKAGILVYFFGTLFVFYTLNWQDSKGDSIAKITVYVHDYLNLIYNLCLAIPFLLYRKAKTFIF